MLWQWHSVNRRKNEENKVAVVAIPDITRANYFLEPHELGGGDKKKTSSLKHPRTFNNNNNNDPSFWTFPVLLFAISLYTTKNRHDRIDEKEIKESNVLCMIFWGLDLPLSLCLLHFHCSAWHTYIGFVWREASKVINYCKALLVQVERVCHLIRMSNYWLSECGVMAEALYSAARAHHTHVAVCTFAPCIPSLLLWWQFKKELPVHTSLFLLSSILHIHHDSIHSRYYCSHGI